MRTTIRLNDNVLRTAKKVAVARHTTLTALIDAGLRYIISLSSVQTNPQKTVKLKTVKGSGLKSGVVLDHNAAILAKMEHDPVRCQCVNLRASRRYGSTRAISCLA